MIDAPRLPMRQRITPVSIVTASASSFTETRVAGAIGAPAARTNCAATFFAGPIAWAVHFSDPSGHVASGQV